MEVRYLRFCYCIILKTYMYYTVLYYAMLTVGTLCNSTPLLSHRALLKTCSQRTERSLKESEVLRSLAPSLSLPLSLLISHPISDSDLFAPYTHSSGVFTFFVLYDHFHHPHSAINQDFTADTYLFIMISGGLNEVRVVAFLCTYDVNECLYRGFCVSMSCCPPASTSISLSTYVCLSPSSHLSTLRCPLCHPLFLSHTRSFTPT